jgi:excisionase family DNA binding protein
MSEKVRSSQKVARTIQETAEALGVSERFVRNKVKAGELPHARIGMRILIRDADLQEWLGAHVRDYEALHANGRSAPQTA